MNHKILLVYDDYAEMIRMQTDLMKMGFDVVGIVNEVLLSDQILIFNPELVITAGRGGKVSAPSVAQKLKEMPKYRGFVLILLPHSQRPKTEELSRIRMDALLEFPAPMTKVIHVLAKLLNLDPKGLFDKYRRLRQMEGASIEELEALQLEMQQAIEPAPKKSDRASRYDKVVRETQVDPKATSLDRQQVKNRWDQIKKDWDPDELEDQDELKQQFARALFKK